MSRRGCRGREGFCRRCELSRGRGLEGVVLALLKNSRQELMKWLRHRKFLTWIRQDEPIQFHIGWRWCLVVRIDRSADRLLGRDRLIAPAWNVAQSVTSICKTGKTEADSNTRMLSYCRSVMRAASLVRSPRDITSRPSRD